LTIQGPEGLSAHIDPDKLQSTLPAELAKKAGELAEKADDDAEIVNAIYSYLTANIDASPLHQKYIGNRVRSSEKVWQSNIATVTERAVLLSSMLKEAGISAMPALLVHKGAMSVLDDNSQMVVRVDLKNEAPLLLPLVKSSAENVLYQHAGKELIPLEKGKTDQRMKIQPKKNAYHFSAQLKLSDDTVTGTGEIMLMHAMNPHLEIRNDENQLKSKVDQLKVTDLSVDQSSSATTKADFEYGMQLKQLTKEHFGRLLMTLPDVQGGITGDDLTLWNERVTPFEIPFPVHGEVDFTFHLEGLKCLNESFEHTQSSKIGEVSVNLEVKPEKVMVRKSFSLHNQCYNPMEYSEIRGILRAFMSDEVNQLIFKRIE
ncbi:MAG: DUF3858 domain-containing protein, partial [Bacteroidota bacterium]